MRKSMTIGLFFNNGTFTAGFILDSERDVITRREEGRENEGWDIDFHMHDREISTLYLLVCFKADQPELCLPLR